MAGQRGAQEKLMFLPLAQGVTPPTLLTFGLQALKSLPVLPAQAPNQTHLKLQGDFRNQAAQPPSNHETLHNLPGE